MGKTNPTDQHLDKFPTVSDFLDRNALIVSGLGLGTHFSLPTAQCAGLCGDDGITNRKPVLRFEYTYPTSDLARSLVTDDLVAGSTDLEAALVGEWKGAHVNWHVERGPRLTADLASPVSKPQGLFFKLIGQGYHNTVYQKSLMWGEDRLYMVRSISKAFASTLLLVLQDRGVLSIDDRVGAYLSEYNDAPGLQDITIRMLLTHTAGFAPFMAQVGDNSPRALTDWTMSLRDSAREISRIPLVSSPGKEFHYTELGYQVAGAVAEVASGRPWYDIFRDFVAKPLDLRHTSWHNTFSPVENPPNPLIAIGVVTTASDLQKLGLMILQRGKHFDGSSCLQVLTESAVMDLTSYQDLGDTTKDTIFAQNSDLFTLSQPLVENGIFTMDDALAVKESWSSIGYGLGAWLATDNATGSRHVFFLGAYTGCVSLLGFSSDHPLISILMSYSKSNPSHAVLAGLTWRDWGKTN